jgi:signal transduction histidine kinase
LPADQIDEVDAAVGRVVEDLGDVERSLRELIVSLERERDKACSLREAIESEIAWFERHADAKVALLMTGTPARLTAAERAAVHAIVRAALANVAKHADARTVTVHVRHHDDETVLAIEDDGRGFNVLEVDKPGHFGLRGIRERAAQVGGHAEVWSKQGGPTIVSAVLTHRTGVAAIEHLPAAV